MVSLLLLDSTPLTMTPLIFISHFAQDGTLSLEIKLTGMLSTNSIPAGSQPQHGTLVAPLVNAQVHQHMFCKSPTPRFPSRF